MIIENKNNKFYNNLLKGNFYLIFAQIIFLISGYVIHIALAHSVNPVEYGRFGIILSILMITNTILGRGVPEAASKYIAEGYNYSNVKKEALKIQSVLCFIIFIVLLLISYPLSILLNDEKMLIYIIILSFILPLRAFLNLFKGILFGLEKFKKGANLIILNSLPRIGFVFLLILLGLGVLGAILGYLFASLLAVIVGVLYINIKRYEGKKLNKNIFIYSYPVILFSVILMLILNLDTLYVKALFSNSPISGYYVSAKTISIIPFSILSAFSMTILPLISRSDSDGNKNLTKFYIRESYRYLFLVFSIIILIVTLAPNFILTLLYPQSYSEASIPLAILIFGTIFLTIFYFISYSINAIEKTIIPTIILLLIFPLYIISNYILIPIYGMIGASISFTAVSFIYMIIGLIFQYKYFRTIFKFISTIKIIFSLSFAYVCGYYMLITGINIFLILFFSLLIYIVLLFLIKELTNRDIESIILIFRKKK